MNLSKSRYCSFVDCPKHCWLGVHKPEACAFDEGVQYRFSEGHRVGELAKTLFGPYEDATVLGGDGRLDLGAMMEKTQALLRAGAQTICEAAFSADGCYCAVDLLHREGGGYAIYEVKSSTSEKEIYAHDIAYQKFVLTRCGITVTGTYLVNINNQYAYNGTLEVDGLLRKIDYAEKIAALSPHIAANCDAAKAVLDSDTEPASPLKTGCDGCDCWAYCSKDIPRPSVLDLGGNFGKWGWYNRGVVTFEEVLKSGISLNEKQRRQIDYALRDLGTFVDKAQIAAFLRTLSYPLYFLDFETVKPVIPEIVGTRPYQTIPVQYSLHSLEHAGGKERHAEFLANPEGDPRRALAERLVHDIPRGVCTLAYHASVEQGIVRDLAVLFPDLADRLSDIAENIKDLEEPFRKGYYYNRAMGKWSSIKVVLPAVFPNDPELDYHRLEGVHSGTEAMYIFPKLKEMAPKERAETEKALLAYCRLDTYAMVKLLQALERACA